LSYLKSKLEALSTQVDNFMGGKSAPAFVKGPKTAIEEYRSRSYYERRQRKHESLVARLVPHVLERGKGKPPVG
jgi:hypothetical protein